VSAVADGIRDELLTLSRVDAIGCDVDSQVRPPGSVDE
jgi:hypothetical protein